MLPPVLSKGGCKYIYINFEEIKMIKGKNSEPKTEEYFAQIERYERLLGRGNMSKRKFNIRHNELIVNILTYLREEEVYYGSTTKYTRLESYKVQDIEQN